MATGQPNLVPGASRSRQIGVIRAALIAVYGLGGTGWAALPILGDMTSAGYWIFGSAALACFAAAFGFATFRRWAPVVAILALLASAGLFQALRAAFSTFPF